MRLPGAPVHVGRAAAIFDWLLVRRIESPDRFWTPREIADELMLWDDQPRVWNTLVDLTKRGITEPGEHRRWRAYRVSDEALEQAKAEGRA